MKLPSTFPMLAGALAVFAATPASAQVLTALNPMTPVVTNTISSPNYYLFDARDQAPGTTASGDVNAAPGYATVTDVASPYLTGSTTIIAGGTSYDSGVLYKEPSPANLATITLNASTPAAFTLGVFLDYDDATVFTLNLYSSTNTLLSSAVLNPGQARDNSPTANMFYYAGVVGATTGDYIQVNGVYGTSSQATVGGLVFEGASVPEPTT